MSYNTDMDKKQRSSFKFVISSQYFLYFGVMGISLPYFNLYCYHLDFTGFQIGVLSALRSVVMVVFSLIWGRLADRFQARRPIFIACNFISAAIWIFFLFTTDFRTMLVIMTCYGIFHAPIISFMEAFAMDVLGREKKNYGSVRVWGTIAFIVVVTVLGKIIDLYSLKIILVLILGGSLLQAFFSLRIPNIKVAGRTSFSLIRTGDQGRKTKRHTIFFLFCAFLMLVSHGAYYGFFSIHLEGLGYGSTFIGVTWALASASEILTMINSDRIFRRFSIENVLIFSFMAAALRWTVLFLATSPALILISQMSHAFTYGTFHIASILYIDSLSADEAKTTGQALNNAVTYGLGMMVGFFLNGYLYELTGSSGLFLVSAFVAFAGGLLLSIFYWKDK